MKKRMLALALCAALLVGASACSQTEADSSSQVSTPSVSVVESEPSPTPEPTPAPTATPAPTPEPESSAAPAEGFEAEFAANPIDQRLEEDLMMASSSSLVLQAYDTAAGFWQDVIDTAYAQAEEALSTDEYAVVQQEQGDWEAALEPAVQEIRAQHGEDEMAAASAGSLAAML